MKFTLSWLKEHLSTECSIEEITNKLTMIGLEVESIENPAEKLKDFFIAEIISVKKHPSADRLNLCEVNTGTEILNIVCGANNVKEGLKVVLAPIGSILPGGLKIKKSSIRGENSNGMLCSFAELELEGDSSGIIEVSSNANIGVLYADFEGLNDPIIEIGITPNRGDCLGVRGVARDLAAAGLGKLKDFTCKEIESSFDSPIKWHIKTNLVSHVAGCYLKDVKNVESPNYVKKRLNAIGIKPKNILVDVTNYINFDLGRPLHAYDADKLEGDLIIRNANLGEKVTALNDIEYKLDESMVVICDNKRVLSIGGIMGGKYSSVTNETKNVFIEAAIFDHINIAKTGRKLDLNTDSRYRFERYVDPLSAIKGLNYACNLITKYAKGENSKLVEDGIPTNKKRKINLNFSKVKEITGINISKEISIDILEKLGIKTEEKNNNVITCTIPTYRNDIEQDVCLIEEILRLYGFENIEAKPLDNFFDVPEKSITLEMKKISSARRFLASRNMNECVNYSFISKYMASFFHDGDLDKGIFLKNAISEDLSVMRPSIIPSLLLNCRNNMFRGFKNLSFFEYGGTYYNSSLEGQKNSISAVRVGNNSNDSWGNKTRALDVIDMKEDLYLMLENMGFSLNGLMLKKNAPKWYHPMKSASVYFSNKLVGHFGSIHPSLLQKFKIKNDVFAFEMFIESLSTLKVKDKSRASYSPSNFQNSSRDFSFELEENVDSGDVLKVIKSIDKKIIKEVIVFDIYRNDKLAGKKSISVRVLLGLDQKTLKDEDINLISEKIISKVKTKFAANIR